MKRQFQLAPSDWGDVCKGTIVNFWLHRRSFPILVERLLTKMRQSAAVITPGAANTSAQSLHVCTQAVQKFFSVNLMRLGKQGSKMRACAILFVKIIDSLNMLQRSQSVQTSPQFNFTRCLRVDIKWGLTLGPVENVLGGHV